MYNPLPTTRIIAYHHHHDRGSHLPSPIACSFFFLLKFLFLYIKTHPNFFFPFQLDRSIISRWYSMGYGRICSRSFALDFILFQLRLDSMALACRLNRLPMAWCWQNGFGWTCVLPGARDEEDETRRAAYIIIEQAVLSLFLQRARASHGSFYIF